MSKQDAYQQLLHAMQGLVEGQRNWVCNLANASSLLWHMYRSLGSPSSSVNWAGFYVRDRNDRAQLILGPFHGKVACQTIKIGDGVCGTAAKEGRMLMLEDVEAFPGHIACDAESKSEIVAPIKVGEKVRCPAASSERLKTIDSTSSPGGRGCRHRLRRQERIRYGRPSGFAKTGKPAEWLL